MGVQRLLRAWQRHVTCCSSHRSKQDKGQGFGSTSSQASSSGKKAEPRKEDRKWQLEAAKVEEWEGWVEEQRKAAGAQGDDIYLQVSFFQQNTYRQIAAVSLPGQAHFKGS